MEILTLKSKEKLGCTLCNKCCVYRGDIRLTPVNVCEISKYLRLDVSGFVRKYTERLENQMFEIVLKTRGDKRECVLYDSANHKCSIHKVKPLQCVMFPLYPENIKRDLFINSGQCQRDEFKELSIDKWLNGNGSIYSKHKDFCIYWIAFLEDVQDIIYRKELDLDFEKIYRILFENYDLSKKNFEKQARSNIDEVKRIIKIKISEK